MPNHYKHEKDMLEADLSICLEYPESRFERESDNNRYIESELIICIIDEERWFLESAVSRLLRVAETLRLGF
ncbi:hypothetical protein TNCV_2740621 [Trichonephila clavipes]|nr:hypothetical protein TNCV_2740621 [Trichonephila clavipes]